MLKKGNLSMKKCRFFIIRILDLCLSLLGIMILTPVFLVIILLLSITGEGKVFYFQERVGFKRKIFKIIKFVTMIDTPSKSGSMTITQKNDSRILPVGYFLRKTKLNELPQLFNVVSGTLSLVGPRPLTTHTFSFYSNEIQEIISSVKPGITGVGSLFFRNEEDIIGSETNSEEVYRNKITPYKGQLEKWFVENYSLKNYIMIIFITLWIVIFSKSNVHKRLFRGLQEDSFKP
jgi:lipopolysaccharide/colanic/teichoic acid biosynthesis glycosyltransferase